MIFDRRPRLDIRPPQASYPAWVRRILFWYDGLTDWQRIQYAVASSLFLIACAGYLLGLGSTVLLQRVEAQDALAAQELALEPKPTEVVVVVEATPSPTITPTPRATATPLPTATPVPTATPFSAPQIAEKPAVPRLLPANPVPAAPAVRAVPTTKPRNLETSKPEGPSASVATPTRAVVRQTATNAVVTTPAPARATSQAASLPTLAVPTARAAATSAAPASGQATPVATSRPAAQTTPGSAAATAPAGRAGTPVPTRTP